ncbi:hypothetical protein ACFL27_27515 [candidate division CSSED10-310 bacterium]|uniref:Phosphohydrolase n=1 Tax=candidate division CSSED10-310 bacterium TaxID=2855610 RepID=A0ABV6Z6A4_UNCC1
MEFPDLALRIAEMVVSVHGRYITDIRYPLLHVENEIVNLVIAVLNQESDPTLHSRDLDLFERVMDLGGYYTDKVLAASDR